MVSELSDETLELNNELLQKELELVALRERIASSTQTKVVYNFIDVPIGSDVSIYDESRPQVSTQNQSRTVADIDDSLLADADLTDLASDQFDLEEDDLSDERIDGLFTDLTEQFSKNQ